MLTGVHHVQLACPGVSDLDQLVARLADEGIVVGWDVDLPGHRRCYVEDPVGNRIELLERV